MTSAKDHPCKQTGLRDVLEILGNPLKPELYFIVPPDRFASFMCQRYHGTDGSVSPKGHCCEFEQVISACFEV